MATPLSTNSVISAGMLSYWQSKYGTTYEAAQAALLAIEAGTTAPPAGLPDTFDPLLAVYHSSAFHTGLATSTNPTSVAAIVAAAVAIATAVFAVLSVQTVNFQGRQNIFRRVTTAATDSVASSTDYFLSVSSTDLAVTLSMPSVTSVGSGAVFFVKDKNGKAATHNITISPNGANTIDGASSLVLSTTSTAVMLVSDGAANWETK